VLFSLFLFHRSSFSSFLLSFFLSSSSSFSLLSSPLPSFLSLFFPPLSGLVQPSNISVVENLFARVIRGTPIVVNTIGSRHVNASDISFYAPLLGSYNATTLYNPIPVRLVREAILDIDWEFWLDLLLFGEAIMPTRLKLYNALYSTLALTRVGLNVTYNNNTIGTSFTSLFEDLTPLYIPIPANNSVVSKEVPVTVAWFNPNVTLEAIGSCFFDGLVVFGLNGTLDISLGKYDMTIDFFQTQDLPTCTWFNATLCDIYDATHAL
jgi:hypothetical protein